MCVCVCVCECLEWESLVIKKKLKWLTNQSKKSLMAFWHKKLKTEKMQALTKCSKKHRRQRNLAAYFADNATRFLNKNNIGMDERLHPSLLHDRWPLNLKGQQRHNSSWFLMLCFSIVSEVESRKFLERLSKKSLYNLTDSKNLSNHRRSMSKEHLGSAIVEEFCKLFDSIHRRKMEYMVFPNRFHWPSG